MERDQNCKVFRNTSCHLQFQPQEFHKIHLLQFIVLAWTEIYTEALFLEKLKKQG